MFLKRSRSRDTSEAEFTHCHYDIVSISCDIPASINYRKLPLVFTASDILTDIHVILLSLKQTLFPPRRFDLYRSVIAKSSVTTLRHFVAVQWQCYVTCTGCQLSREGVDRYISLGKHKKTAYISHFLVYFYISSPYFYLALILTTFFFNLSNFLSFFASPSFLPFL
jgi:hypothetical protein